MRSFFLFKIFKDYFTLTMPASIEEAVEIPVKHEAGMVRHR